MSSRAPRTGPIKGRRRDRHAGEIVLIQVILLHQSLEARSVFRVRRVAPRERVGERVRIVLLSHRGRVGFGRRQQRAMRVEGFGERGELAEAGDDRDGLPAHDLVGLRGDGRLAGTGLDAERVVGAAGHAPSPIPFQDELGQRHRGRHAPFLLAGLGTPNRFGCEARRGAQRSSRRSEGRWCGL